MTSEAVQRYNAKKKRDEHVYNALTTIDPATLRQINKMLEQQTKSVNKLIEEHRGNVLAQTETRMRQEMSGWIEDNTEQIDWMCEQIAAQKAESVRLSNKISEQAAEITKLQVLWERIEIIENTADANTMAITIRRVDNLFPRMMDHHLRLLKLEEAHEQA